MYGDVGAVWVYDVMTRYANYTPTVLPDWVPETPNLYLLLRCKDRADIIGESGFGD